MSDVLKRRVLGGSRSVKRVYTYCPNLTYLDVSHCGTLNWSCVTELVKHCPRLQHLQIAYCSSINDKALGAIAGSPFGETQGLLHLRTLDVTGCNQITDKGLRMLQKCHVRAFAPAPAGSRVIGPGTSVLRAAFLQPGTSHETDGACGRLLSASGWRRFEFPSARDSPI
jgi:hypothetical protein